MANAKLFGDQYVTLGVGPRILGSSGAVDVLATVAITSDADNLVNDLLSPPAK